MRPEVVAALAGEVQRLLSGTRLQAVYQPLPYAVVLHLYGERRVHRLAVDVEPSRLCVGLLQEPGPPNPPVPSAFCMLLRKHLEGARLVASACQPGDRVLYLRFVRLSRSTSVRSGEKTAFTDAQDAVLIVELTGRGANILLQRDGRLAGWLRAPAETRGLRLDEAYRPPPPGPAAGEPVAGDGESPGLPADEEGLLGAFGRWWRARIDHDRLEERRRQLLKSLQAASSRLARRLENQMSDLAESCGFERWLEAGQLLLAYADRIPRGSRQVTLPPPDQASEDRPALCIDIQPELSPVENAQLLFRRYRKARRAAQIQQAAAETTRRALFSLELASTLARQARSLADLDRIEQELPPPSREALEQSRKPSRAGRPTAHAPVPAGREPRQRAVLDPPSQAIARLCSSDGCPILVGRTATANDHLTLHLARPDDLWLHARGVPGAHVVIRCGPDDPPQRTLLEAAVLAARYCSVGASAAAVEVDVTRRRHVRKPPGAPPGFVLYDHERTVRVRPGQDPGPPTSLAPVDPAT